MSSRIRPAVSASSDTRTKILDAALAALMEGSGGFKIGRVAQIAGISRQAVYLHFRSRTELLIAAARRTDQRLELDLGFSKRRFVETMRLAFSRALLSETEEEPA